jgi:hypothetical protein
MTGLGTLPSTREQARHGLLLLGVPASPRLLVEVHRAIFDGDLSVPALAALIRDEERALGAADVHDPMAGADGLEPDSDSTPGADRLGSPRGSTHHAGGLGPRRGSASDAAGRPAPRRGSASDPAGLGSRRGSASDPGRPAPRRGSASDPGRLEALRESGPDAGGLEPLSPTERRSCLVCPGLNLDLTAARGLVTLSTWPIAGRIATPATARAEALASVIRVAEFVAARPGASGTSLLRQLAEIVPGGPEAIDALNPLALADVARAALDDAALADAVAAEAPARDAAAARAADLHERHRLFGLPTVPHQRGGA